MMTLSIVIESLANILLFLGGFLFAADTITYFNQGKSSFTETQVDVTSNDMPTLAFCYLTTDPHPDNIDIWQAIYERQETSEANYDNQFRLQDGKWLELNVPTNIGDYRFTLEKIREFETVISSSGNAVLACYKISGAWIHAGSDDIRQLVVKAGFF